MTPKLTARPTWRFVDGDTPGDGALWLNHPAKLWGFVEIKSTAGDERRIMVAAQSFVEAEVGTLGSSAAYSLFAPMLVVPDGTPQEMQDSIQRAVEGEGFIRWSTALGNNESGKEWERRADAIGKAQFRYLWVGLVLGLFFIALFNAPAGTRSVKVPLIDLSLDGQAVLAAGGATLAFVLIALLGSLRAWGDAMKAALGPDWEKTVERRDIHPTAFDLAHYTTRQHPLAEKAGTLLFYPTFLLLLSIESAWLLIWLWRSAAPGRAVFLVVGAPLWVWAAYHVGDFWWRRIRKVRAV